MARIHLHLSHGETHDGKCATCGTETLLVSMRGFHVDCDAEHELAGDVVETNDEITGHYCPACQVLTSLSFNQLQ